MDKEFKEILLDIVRNNSEELIQEWLEYFSDDEKDDEHRRYDDFLGFFEECIEADLRTNSDEDRALQHFLIKLKDIIGEDAFFNFNNSIYTCFLKFPILKLLEDRGYFKYDNIKTITAFFESTTSRIALDILSKNREFQDISMKELAEREAPISEIWEGVLMVSIVGTLDSQRVLQIIDKVLSYLEKGSFDSVVVDISSIFDVNSEVAAQLIKLSNAIHFMGSKAYLSGITSSIAKSLTHLDISLGDIKTYSTTKKAVEYIVRNK